MTEITISICNNGVKDTNLSIWNTDPHSLVKRLKTCTAGEKDGSYFIRTTGTNRNNTDTADIASVLILDGDKRIDTDTGEVLDGAPDPAMVSDVLKTNDINHILFSSYSNGRDGANFHKYRVVIPINYSREQLPTLLDHIHEALHDAGAMLFNVTENRSWAQAWYFPRCPQEHLHLFKSFDYWDGAELDAGQLCRDYLTRHPVQAEPTPKKSEPARIKSAQNRLDPIRLFNDYWKSPVNYLLTQGYKPKGSRLLHPSNQSGVAGVQVCHNCVDGVERVFSHGCDALNDGYPHDTFDCFVILEHAGNFTAALLDIARSWTVNGMAIEDFNRMTYQSGQFMRQVNFIADSDGHLRDGYNIYNNYNKPPDACLQSHGTQGMATVVDPLQQIYNKPTTFNKKLDTEASYCLNVDLLKHLDDDNLLKKLSIQTAACCQLPVNTVFLALLGVFSSVSCRKWTVDYQYSGSLPIGIYAVVEQPSGTGKTRCLTIGQKPFTHIKDEVVKKYRERVKELQVINEPSEPQAEELQELLSRKSAVNSRLFVSNATAEGLEQTLLGTNGFFSAISSEQGLFNSLLGLSYSKGDPNNDLILNGFDGGHISSCRVSRDGYHGYVIGGVTLFAQQGSVEKILSCSNGTGMSERFLMLAEPHFLGRRNHLKKIHIDPTIETDYALKCEFSRDIFNQPESPGDLLHLKITEGGHLLIAQFRQSIEQHLVDGGRYSHISVRGAAGKVNMQVMKIAANLHLLTRLNNFDPNIPDSIINSAIGIARDLLEANLALCKAKGLIGDKAEFTAILNLFEGNHKPMTERQIIQSRARVSPFKDFTGNKSDLIREALAGLESENLLASLVVDGAKRYFLKQ